MTSPASEPVPLQSPWTLWVFDPSKKSMKRGNKLAVDDYTSTLKKVYTFSTIQEFWSCFNNLPSVSTLQPGSAFHFMREDIEPKWEHSQNETGGIYCLRIDKVKTNEAWTDIVLSVIGEQFLSVLDESDAINGITISAKKNDNVIQVWNHNAKADRTGIESKILSITKTSAKDTLFYKLCGQS